MSPTPQDVVELYLRAQNLEQVRRTDEAVELYEQAVAAGFDSAGPYDRLILIYQAREQHANVVRVAAAALEHVRTFDDKRASYEALLADSRAALAHQPDRRGSEF
jgi:tetratricopeptide (TPR) repeat protein